MRVHVRIPGHLAAMAPALVAAAPGPRRITIEAPRAGTAEPALAAPLRDHPQASIRPVIFARLVAAEDGYRIRTRGTSLTPDEVDELAGRIRDALREFGFADRPVTIAAAAGTL